jgi:uncharacterized protein (TIGR02217 family)
MPFLETPRFPDDISYGSQGGPAYNTSIVVIKSGHESRNVNWSTARHNYDVSYGVKTVEQLSSLINYFHATGGMAYGFRYKDFLDCKSSGNHKTTVNPTDQLIGTGDDSETVFQLVKIYTKGAYSRTRDITKPITGTVRIAINDVEKLEGDGTYPWSVDTITGIITFSGTPPPNSESVKAGFEFDVPVRFDTDELMVNYEAYEQGAANVPLIEIRDIA